MAHRAASYPLIITMKFTVLTISQRPAVRPVRAATAVTDGAMDSPGDAGSLAGGAGGAGGTGSGNGTAGAHGGAGGAWGSYTAGRGVSGSAGVARPGTTFHALMPIADTFE